MESIRKNLCLAFFLTLNIQIYCMDKTTEDIIYDGYIYSYNNISVYDNKPQDEVTHSVFDYIMNIYNNINIPQPDFLVPYTPINLSESENESLESLKNTIASQQKQINLLQCKNKELQDIINQHNVPFKANATPANIRSSINTKKYIVNIDEILDQVLQDDDFGLLAGINLITQGIDINNQDNGTKTSPLHFAAACDAIALIKILIENHADINIQDSNGNTPLHIAVLCSKPYSDNKLIRILLDAGADRSIHNNIYHTPARMAYMLDKVDVIDLFDKSLQSK